jgi:hypothetical protein
MPVNHNWTTPSTWASGDWNLQIRENLNHLYYDLLPAGTIIAYCSTDLPTGYLLCNATAVTNVAPYTKLYAKLPGSGTKYTPNLVDRFVVAAGSGYAVNTSGGSATNDLRHTHGIGTISTDGGGSGTTGGPSATATFQGGVATGRPTQDHTHTTPAHNHPMKGDTGAASVDFTSVTNIPPYYALTYIIKY